MRQRTRGQAVLEFGVLAMLFIMLLFGIFDFGMLFNDWISITAGASVGARQAAVGACLEPTCSGGETSIVEAVMSSPPLLAVSPVATDIAVVDLQVPAAYCRHTVRNADGTLTITAITSGWAPQGVSCSVGSPAPQINDTLTIVVRAEVDIPAPLFGMPATMQIPSSATVRYEGDFVA